MKKRYIYIVLFMVLSLFISVQKVEGLVVAVECPVNKENPSSGDDETWLFFRSFNSDNRSGWMFYNGKDSGTKFWIVDWCWHVNPDDRDKNCDAVENYGEGGVTTNLEQGYCPVSIRSSREGENMVLGGISDTPGRIISIDDSQFLFSKSTADSRYIILEYYDRDGNYNAVPMGFSLSNFFAEGFEDIIRSRIIDSEGTITGSIFEVNEKNSYFSSERSEGEYTPLFGSSYAAGLPNIINDWFNDSSANVNEQEKYFNEYKQQYNKLSNNCSAFVEQEKNNASYTFPSDYSETAMFNDLEGALDSLKNVYSVSSGFPIYDLTGATGKYGMFENSLTTYVLYRYGIGGELYIGNNSGALQVINSFIINESRELGKTVTDVTGKLDEELTTLTECVSYLDDNSDIEGLSELRGLYEEFAAERDIYVVVGCKGLLGQDLIDKIKSYTNIIKIVVPIILLGFGIVDFAKAVFSGSDDDMKKSQKNFIKRLGIAILIFFVPTIIDLLLAVANKVWGIISPDSCGLF